MLDFKKFEILTFDCYGTLIDWETGILRALQPLLEKYDQDLKDHEVLELYGRFESTIQKSGYMKYRDVLRNVMYEFSSHCGFSLEPGEAHAIAESLGGWQPFPDTVAALCDLRTWYRLGILSNIDDDLFEQTCEHLQTDFDEVVTAQQVKSYKPAHGHWKELLRRTELPPGAVLHVAQSLYHDVPPARELGIATVWVNRRHDRPGTGATPPADAKPDLEVPDLRSLVDLIHAQIPR